MSLLYTKLKQFKEIQEGTPQAELAHKELCNIYNASQYSPAIRSLCYCNHKNNLKLIERVCQ